jgi:hypothetical protein
LNGYHAAGRFNAASVAQRPWQAQYGARASALVSIVYGISNADYTIVIGVLPRPEWIKTVIRSATAVVHACEIANKQEVVSDPIYSLVPMNVG